MKRWCVYVHTAPSHKVYVGITSQNPIKRWNNGLGYNRQIYFYRAILKYGWDNIKHEIIVSGISGEEAKSRNNVWNNKAVLQCSKQGVFIKEWNTISEASRVLNISQGNIVACCKGRLKSAGGFIWKYK